jgi:hypothetical protein
MTSISFKIQNANREPGSVVQLKHVDIHECLNLLEQIRDTLSESNVPIVIVLDIPISFSKAMENKLLWLLRDLESTNIVIWLHTPLYHISKSLLSQFGCFVVFYASRADVEAIHNFLPIPKDFPFGDMLEKALIYTPSMGLDKHKLFDLEKV